MVKIICPKCKSNNIRTYSQKKYLRWLGICMVLTAFFSWVVIALIARHYLDLIIFLALTVGVIGIASSGITGVYALIRLLLIKQTNYKCQDCKSKFVEGLQIEYDAPK